MLDGLKLNKLAALFATDVVCRESFGTLLATVEMLVCTVVVAVVAGVLAIAGNLPTLLEIEELDVP